MRQLHVGFKKEATKKSTLRLFFSRLARYTTPPPDGEGTSPYPAEGDNHSPPLLLLSSSPNSRFFWTTISLLESALKRDDDDRENWLLLSLFLSPREGWHHETLLSGQRGAAIDF